MTPTSTSKVDKAEGKRTPLARASPAANRARPVTPSKQPSAKGKEKAITTSTKRAGVNVPSPSPVKRPASNVPLSSAKRCKTADGEPAPLTPELEDMLDEFEEEEEVVVDENGYIRLPAAPVSRETFLANEKLRRQREARNFKYTGSADAPKLTRSGRIIGEVDKTEDEAYGTVDEDDPFIDAPTRSVLPVEDTPELEVDGRVEEQDLLEKEMEEQAKEVMPLPPGGEPCLRGVLDTLTGRNIAHNPPPFLEEEKNEALNGLVNLLKGTVERGEGNSALVVGARGVGKTRVRLFPSYTCYG